MDYCGKNLVADTEAVWEAVTKYFPEMAGAYRSANVNVHLTKGLNSLDIEFLSQWCPLRDELEYIFADSANTFHDTAEALFAAMNSYAGVDAEAADALEGATKDLPDSVPELGETTIPESGRYYASDDYYSPAVPEENYDGNAPTVDELIEQAKKTEDKLWEAKCTELGWIEGTIEWLLPDDITKSEPGYDKHVALIDKVKEVTKYDPAEFSSAISSLAKISEEKHGFMVFSTEVENAKDALDPDKWDGDAARSFRKNFLNAYEDIRDTQVVLLGTLQGSLEGYQEALENTYESYAQVLKQSEEAAEAIVDGGASPANSLITAVLSAGIAVASAVATGGTALTFALAGSGISIGAAAMSAGGSTVNEIHENLFESLDTAKTKLDDLDAELVSALKSDLDMVVDGRHKAEANIDFPRPKFIDDPSSF